MGGEASSCNTLHWPHFPVFDSVIKILADKQTSQTDQHLKCDARVRDFCLRTVDSINRNLSVRLPLNLPQLHVPQLPKAVSLPHRLLVKHLRHWSPPPPTHPPCQTAGTAARLCHRNNGWQIWRAACQESHSGEKTRKHVQSRWLRRLRTGNSWYTLMFESFSLLNVCSL